jgi:glycosyltransferase involved in cell wall biosynthesis
MSPLHVCIVGLKCYDHIAAKSVPRYLGGIETQLTILAKGLVAQGCRVSLITYDHGQPDAEIFDGVTVFKSYHREAGVRIIRSLYPRSIKLWKAMHRADADVYLQMGAGAETGLVALGCRLSVPRKRFVFCLASNANFGKHLRAGMFGWEGKLYQFGLRRADLVISQTNDQRDGLRRAVGRESHVVPMAVRQPKVSEAPAQRPEENRVLWIGRITPDKRLEWLLDAADKCPDSCFDVVGAPNTASEYAERILQASTQHKNVTIHGRLSAAELEQIYENTRLLCCTSQVEGFPTSFLEAWSRGIPVVTTFDPDGIVARHRLGGIAKNPAELAGQLRNIIEDKTKYAALSQAAKRYYLDNHTVEKVSRQFRNEFENLQALSSGVIAVPSLT